MDATKILGDVFLEVAKDARFQGLVVSAAVYYSWEFLKDYAGFRKFKYSKFCKGDVITRGTSTGTEDLKITDVGYREITLTDSNGRENYIPMSQFNSQSIGWKRNVVSEKKK